MKIPPALFLMLAPFLLPGFFTRVLLQTQISPPPLASSGLASSTCCQTRPRASALRVPGEAGLSGFSRRALVKNPGSAQEKDEVSLLARLIPRAVKKASPWLVTVQVYGGTRAALAPPASKPKGKAGKKGGKKRLLPRGAPRFPVARGATTGVILSPGGLVLTSLWSFQLQPVAVVVGLPDGRRFTAKALGRDFSRGLALLKIEGKDLPCPEAAPPASYRTGAWVLALGRVFGPKTPEVSLGIVSATGRIGGKAVQTDASVSPADYGGALVDLSGRILGLLVPLSPRGYAAGIRWYDSGVGFAADWRGILSVLPRLEAGEDLYPGFLGVATSPADLGPGAKIASVTGPAKKAGLRKGDRILALSGEKIHDPFHLKRLLAARYAGERVLIVLRRGKKDVELQVPLGRRPTPVPSRTPFSRR